jgi:hypothetical protein
MSLDREQIKMMRKTVEVNNTSPEDLLKLDDDSIKKMSSDDLALAMQKIKDKNLHLKEGQPGFSEGYLKYLNRAQEIMELEQ